MALTMALTMAGGGGRIARSGDCDRSYAAASARLIRVGDCGCKHRSRFKAAATDGGLARRGIERRHRLHRVHCPRSLRDDRFW